MLRRPRDLSGTPPSATSASTALSGQAHLGDLGRLRSGLGGQGPRRTPLASWLAHSSAEAGGAEALDPLGGECLIQGSVVVFRALVQGRPPLLCKMQVCACPGPVVPAWPALLYRDFREEGRAQDVGG